MYTLPLIIATSLRAKRYSISHCEICLFSKYFKRQCLYFLDFSKKDFRNSYMVSIINIIKYVSIIFLMISHPNCKRWRHFSRFLTSPYSVQEGEVKSSKHSKLDYALIHFTFWLLLHICFMYVNVTSGLDVGNGWSKCFIGSVPNNITSVLWDIACNTQKTILIKLLY